MKTNIERITRKFWEIEYFKENNIENLILINLNKSTQSMLNDFETEILYIKSET